MSCPICSMGGCSDAPPGLLRFRRSDYHGDPAVALADAVRDTVERETGIRPAGPIRLLTNLRSLGLCFNPVSFYYCFDAAGQQLQAVLAEVTNTPWGERQAYVIAGEAGRFQKLMHVSPFMPMDQAYTLRTGPRPSVLRSRSRVIGRAARVRRLAADAAGRADAGGCAP